MCRPPSELTAERLIPVFLTITHSMMQARHGWVSRLCAEPRDYLVTIDHVDGDQIIDKLENYNFWRKLNPRR